MKMNVVFTLLLLLSYSLALSASGINGRVTSQGKGLQNVIVTDGFTCVQTNKNGTYSLPLNKDARFVYISTPSGYLPNVENGTIPRFYKQVQKDISKYDFELKKNLKDDNNHIFIVQTDVQMSDEKDLGLYKTLLPYCADFIGQNKDKEIFGLDGGDISGDNLSILPGYIDAVSILNIPIYRTVGNHDMDYNGRTHETSYRTFESHFGPIYYSFNKGNAHYIVINNTFFIGREYFYMGYIDEKTFSWLEQDLSYIEPGSPVFIMMHIPTRKQAEHTSFGYTANEVASQTINYQPLHKLLEPYHTHIISGHLHYTLNVYHNDNLYEHITPAVSGAWWQGDICLDGAPMGYGVYEVNGKEVKWYYKGFKEPRDYQFKAYRQGTYKDYPNDIIVNVWDWDPAWKVEWAENDVSKGQMERFEGFDADAIDLCSKELKYNWISPVKTSHLFKATPAGKQSHIKIKVTDRFGNVFEKELRNEK